MTFSMVASGAAKAEVARAATAERARTVDFMLNVKECVG